MDDAKITFFMLVTDRDIVMANYAVMSYSKIKDISFKLQVYSNWISSDLKQKYFPVWQKFDYVEIIENNWQTDTKRPVGSTLEGPFERGATVWDRELKKITTPYHATVDADFEILDAKFISVMLNKLDSDSNLVAISTDYSSTNPEQYDSYSDEIISLNERWHTWFCIYRREALQCQMSHAYYEEITSGPIRRNAWDESGYFQETLKETHGFKLDVLDNKYQRGFIHYGAFSKNCDINETNVSLYRSLQILCKCGSPIFTRKLAGFLYKIFFGQTDKKRSKYVDGWGKT